MPRAFIWESKSSFSFFRLKIKGALIEADALINTNVSMLLGSINRA